MMNNLYGNYIGEFIEVIIIKKYTIIYKYNAPKNTLESYLLYTDNFKCIGICFSETDMRDNMWRLMIDKNNPEKIRYACGIDDNNTYATDDELKSILGKENFISFNELNGEYEITLYDGNSYTAEKHETYENGEIIPKDMDATADNLGECLREWFLGVVQYTDFNKPEIRVEINTPKHMYIFLISHGFLYCRAATYSTCNQGFFFLQNFRQNFHNKEGLSMMIKDNRDALKDAAIFMDETLFDPKACVIAYGIYWSVSSFEKDEIILHGCGGEEYRWIKPQMRKNNF